LFFYFFHLNVLIQIKNKLHSIIKWKWVPAILIAFFPGYLFLYSAWGSVLISLVLRFWIYGSAVLLITFLFTLPDEQIFNFKSFFIALIIFCSSFLMANKLKEVVTYPFNLYWSEGNRFWDYSVLFARNKYIYPADKPIFTFIELGRQSLWGLPFLLGNPSILLMRLWDVILFSIPYALLGIVIFRKKYVHKGVIYLAGLWVLLFLDQGPIYTPLIFSAMLVIFAFEIPLVWASLLVLFAGYYANLARYTWSFAPAIWAGLMAFFSPTNSKETPYKINWVRFICLVATGIFGGFILPMIIPLANNAAPDQTQTGVFSSAQTTLQNQSLIWSRLLPNPTYATGILLGLILATLPLVIIIIYFSIKSKLRLNLLQSMAVLGTSLLFLAVGLIASVKIGGGSNLHNLDMFLINLLIIAGLVWKYGIDQKIIDFKSHSTWVNGILATLVVLPVCQTLFTQIPYKFATERYQQNVIKAIQDSADVAKKSGEVLFIDQRQLLTFGYVTGIPLIVDYEKKYLMNEAMSNDQALFNKFYLDLKDHRFSLIINEPIFIDYQAEEVDFGTENDAWVKWVSKPLLCYYQPQDTYKNVNVELLIPRTPPPDPALQCPN
jgi:hypothetical protein